MLAFRRSLLAIACAAAVIYPTAAHALGGFDLRWDSCGPAGGSTVKVINCANESAIDYLYATVIPGVAVPNFAAYEAYIDIIADDGHLEDFWLNALGNCGFNSSGGPAPSPSCPAATTNGSSVWVVRDDASHARMYVAGLTNLNLSLAASTEYTLFRLIVDHSAFFDCPEGCGEPVRFVLTEVHLESLNGSLTVLTTPLRAPSAISKGQLRVDHLVPNSCTPIGSTTVRIIGGGFDPGFTAQLTHSGQPSIPGTSLVYVGPYEIQATFDLVGVATVAWDIEVTMPGPATASKVGAFIVGGLSGVWPNRSLVTSTVSVAITGCGFVTGAVAKLTRSGYPDIVTTSTTVLSESSVQANFDFVNEAPGSWTVVVTNPSGHLATLTNGYKLDTPANGNLNSTFSSLRTQIRQNWSSESSFRLKQVGGTVPWSGLALLAVRVDPLVNSVGIKHVFTEQPGPVPQPTTLDLGQVTPVSDGAERVVALLTIPDVPFPVMPQGYDFTLIPTPSWPPGTDILPICTQVFQAREDAISAGNIAASAIGIGGNRLGFSWPTFPVQFDIDYRAALTVELRSRIVAFSNDPAGHQTYARHEVVLREAVDAALAAVSSTYPTEVAGYQSIWNLMKASPTWEQFTLKLDEDYDNVPTSIVGAVLWPMGAKCDDVTVLASVDPNDKTGPSGPGAAHYFEGTGALPYTIVFENLPTATAPAQIVRVTDTLDPNHYDLSTFQLGRIRFGDRVVELPVGLRQFQAEVDLRPETELLVGIDVRLDDATGVVSGTFLSLDPATGALTDDAAAGFLPPDVAHPEGEGSISFTVALKEGLASGTTISNQATIVFDYNDPIDTPVWSNTLDLDLPSSQVQALGASQDATSFPVTWSGSDAVSGVESYTIYVSADGGPYSIWLEHTPATTAPFPGAAGHTYSFYSVARDRVGWTETAPLVADATTGVGGATGALPPPFLQSWGDFGSGTGEFDQPEALAVGQGTLYVADLILERIQKFTTGGAYLLSFGSPGTGPGQFQSPSGVAVDGANMVYVTDYLNHRVQKFTSAGAYVTSWGGPGAGNGQFDRPDGIAVSPSGTLYVVDSYNHRIQQFSSTGTFLGKWGTQGSGPGQLHNPAGIAIDTEGNVYVSDANNHRIQKFTGDGTFVRAWGTFGTGPGQFDTPQGVATDETGNVYVADYFNSRIQEFTTHGAYVTQWGALGTGNGQFETPSDVAVDDLFRVFVADFGNHRVQKFGRGTVTDREPFLPSQFAFSVAPNPARVARLSFDLPQEADVELAVFDLQGRQLATIFTGHLPAGRHSRQWSGETSSGTRAGPGMYFYRIHTGDVVRTVRGVRVP